MENLKDIKLIDPVHIELITDGHGYFPDSYKLTKEGIKLFQEFGKQCFEAGFEAGTDSEFNGGFNRLEFEDYLKSLENE